MSSNPPSRCFEKRTTPCPFSSTTIVSAYYHEARRACGARLLSLDKNEMRERLRHGHRDGSVPEGGEAPNELWVRCPRCRQLLYRAEHEQLLGVCSKCKYHFRMRASDRIAATVDSGSFCERDANLLPVDPLGFTTGASTYREKLEQGESSTGRPEGFMYGKGSIDGAPVVVGAIDMDFIGGSMGTIVGEKVTRAMEAALEERLPLILFSCSGGARMQEGVVALMQLAKVLSRNAQLHGAGLPFISVMTDPCYGGVTASFAMLGDVNIGEPGAFIGFAGPRVIEQTTREKLPPGAAQAEFLLEHGMLDLVVPRGDMRNTLSRLLKIYAGGRERSPATEHVANELMNRAGNGYELEFEASARSLDSEIGRLRKSGGNDERIQTLESELEEQLSQIYGGLSPHGKRFRSQGTVSVPICLITSSGCAQTLLSFTVTAALAMTARFSEVRRFSTGPRSC